MSAFYPEGLAPVPRFLGASIIALAWPGAGQARAETPSDAARAIERVGPPEARSALQVRELRCGRADRDAARHGKPGACLRAVPR